MERRRVEKGQVDDLVLLDTTTEASIVQNLQTTLKADRIYTWIGPVLISVNPFRQISGLYTPELIRKYRGRYTWELAPHVYAVAEDSYRALMSSHLDQVILITGESGAGKTEAAKKVMEYVAAVSPLAAPSDVNIKDRLLQSNPVLEAFGNAKTIRNNNSSRFGKFMELVFDYHGRPVGGRVTNYLLEKPRVVAPAANERSFHAFYFLLAGATDAEREAMKLRSADSYRSLQSTGCLTVAGMSDVDECLSMRTAMRLVGFSEAEEQDMLRLLAAILTLQNIDFSPAPAGGGGPLRAAAGDSKSALDVSASLLGVAPAELERALTHRTITAHGESITSPLVKADECVETARALVKATYARMFIALVERINGAIRPPGGAELTMGVLDIYGFEIFELNSFEQLCINFANEKLQQFFIEATLRGEQEEYAKEGIAWEDVDYFDNKIVCDLIEARKPAGLLSYLDEESLVPRGTDDTFHAKIAEHLGKHAHFSVPVAPGAARGLFTIRHYAGDVTYSSHLLLEKNKDALFDDLLKCAGSSQHAHVRSLFPESKQASGARKRPPTAATQFRTSMADLVAALTKCTPHYIRTIKPNDDKRAGLFDIERVTHQVRYLGLLENVRVRRAGYAFRQPLSLFADRFRVLSPLTWPLSQCKGDHRAEAKAILDECAVSADAYTFGTTKLFVRRPLTLFTLEELRARRLHDVARMLQTAWRGFASRKYFLEVREQAKGIFGGQKRRRGSWALYLLGDYVRAAESPELNRLLSKRGESRILFADVVEKVNRKKVTQPRTLVITEGAVYTLTPGTMKQTNRVPLASVVGVSMSTFADGFFLLRVAPGLKEVPADLILCSVRKAEILTTLVNVARDGGRTLSLEFSDRLEYRSKKATGMNLFSSGTVETRALTFSEDPSLGSQVARAELDEASLAEKKGGSLMRVRVSPVLGSLAPVQIGKIAGGPPKTAWEGTAAAAKKAAAGPPRRPSLTGGYSSGGGAGGSAYGERRIGGGGAAPSRHPPPATSKAPPVPPPPVGRRQTFSSFPTVQAMHGFKASDGEQLAFDAGAVLHVLEQGNAEWWTAEWNGKVGLVPSNHLKWVTSDVS